MVAGRGKGNLLDFLGGFYFRSMQGKSRKSRIPARDAAPCSGSAPYGSSWLLEGESVGLSLDGALSSQRATS